MSTQAKILEVRRISTRTSAGPLGGPQATGLAECWINVENIVGYEGPDALESLGVVLPDGKFQIAPSGGIDITAEAGGSTGVQEFSFVQFWIQPGNAYCTDVLPVRGLSTGEEEGLDEIDSVDGSRLIEEHLNRSPPRLEVPAGFDSILYVPSNAREDPNFAHLPGTQLDRMRLRNCLLAAKKSRGIPSPSECEEMAEAKLEAQHAPLVRSSAAEIVSSGAGGAPAASRAKGTPNAIIHYILPDGAKLIPRYFVRFSYDLGRHAEEADDFDFGPEEGVGPHCNFCAGRRKRQAVWYCVNDRAYACDECDRRVHSVSEEVLHKHVRYRLDSESFKLGLCSVHPQAVARYYDSLQGDSLCEECAIRRRTDWSARGVDPDSLLDLASEFQECTTQLAEVDGEVSETLHLQSDRIAQLHSLTRNLRAKEAKLHMQIIRSARQALTLVSDETDRKISAVAREEVLLTASMAELRRHGEFLSKERRRATYAEFLRRYPSFVFSLRQKVQAAQDAAQNDLPAEDNISLRSPIAVGCPDRPAGRLGEGGLQAGAFQPQPISEAGRTQMDAFNAFDRTQTTFMSSQTSLSQYNMGTAPDFGASDFGQPHFPAFGQASAPTPQVDLGRGAGERPWARAPETEMDNGHYRNTMRAMGRSASLRQSQLEPALSAPQRGAFGGTMGHGLTQTTGTLRQARPREPADERSMMESLFGEAEQRPRRTLAATRLAGVPYTSSGLVTGYLAPETQPAGYAAAGVAAGAAETAASSPTVSSVSLPGPPPEAVPRGTQEALGSSVIVHTNRSSLAQQAASQASYGAGREDGSAQPRGGSVAGSDTYGAPEERSGTPWTAEALTDQSDDGFSSDGMGGSRASSHGVSRRSSRGSSRGNRGSMGLAASQLPQFPHHTEELSSSSGQDSYHDSEPGQPAAAPVMQARAMGASEADSGAEGRGGLQGRPPGGSAAGSQPTPRTRLASSASSAAPVQAAQAAQAAQAVHAAPPEQPVQHTILGPKDPLPFEIFSAGQILVGQSPVIKGYLYDQLCNMLRKYGLGGRGMRPVLSWSASKGELKLAKLYSAAKPDCPWILIGKADAKNIAAILCTTGLRLGAECSAKEVSYVDLINGKKEAITSCQLSFQPTRITIGAAQQISIVGDFKSVSVDLLGGMKKKKFIYVEYWTFEWV